MENKKYEKYTYGWLKEQQKIKAKKDGFDNIEDWLKWKAEDNRKKYEKGTLGWLRTQQKINAKKDGFDDIDKWLEWKADPFNLLEKKYGEEFTDWARENGDKIPKCWLDLGCKTLKEYLNILAQRAGFKEWNDKRREYARNYSHSTGKCLPLELSACWSLNFGEFTENIMIRYYPGAKRMHYGNPGFDYLWKDEEGKDVEINNKGRCLKYRYDWSPYLAFKIGWNKKAKKFLLSGWDNSHDLNPLIAWEFDKDEMIRKGRGKNSPKVEFWKRDTFQITYTQEELEQFEDHQIDIGWLIESCRDNKDKKSIQCI